jgi:hypothetical protein
MGEKDGLISFCERQPLIMVTMVLLSRKPLKVNIEKN